MIKTLQTKWTSERFRRRTIGWASASLFAILLLASLFSPTIQVPEKKFVKKPDFAFEGVRITFYEAGEEALSLEADMAEVYTGDEIATLTATKGAFYKDGEPFVLFNSPSSRININNSNMLLFHANALIKSEMGHVNITSKELIWLEEDKSFKGLGYTKVIKDNISLEGELFKVNLPVKTLYMAQNGRAVIGDASL